jgi:hypothetical protein
MVGQLAYDLAGLLVTHVCKVHPPLLQLPVLLCCSVLSAVLWST